MPGTIAQLPEDSRWRRGFQSSEAADCRSGKYRRLLAAVAYHENRQGALIVRSLHEATGGSNSPQAPSRHAECHRGVGPPKPLAVAHRDDFIGSMHRSASESSDPGTLPP